MSDDYCGTNIRIPRVLLEEFMKEPRIVLDVASPGYWPVPLHILKGNEYFEKLFSDPEFAKTHQVVIMKTPQMMR